MPAQPRAFTPLVAAAGCVQAMAPVLALLLLRHASTTSGSVDVHAWFHMQLAKTDSQELEQHHQADR